MMTSHYDFICGAVDAVEVNGIRISMWHESNCYHVRSHDFNEHKRIEWNSFKLLSKARQDFARMKKRHLKIKDVSHMNIQYEIDLPAIRMISR